jgi:tRNA pseudouridine13 synthase
MPDSELQRPASAVLRHEPGLSTADLPGTGGRIGENPEDFTVDEVAAFVPSGSGDHFWVRLRKRNRTTPALVREIARAAGVDQRELGYAGLKDKRAVTSQWLSVPASASPPERWALPEDIELLEATRHARKLRTGQQRGNVFAVRIVGVCEGALERAEAICGRIRQDGLHNSFGEQRFGRDGDNLSSALDWLRRGAPGRDRFLRKLYPSVIQSEVFNRYLSARRELDFSRLIAGEIVRLDGSSSVFVVLDPELEHPRLERRDIHLTGPIVGPKAKQAEGNALALEAAVINELGLAAAELDALARLAPGSRRDLVVFPEELSVQMDSPGTLLVRFFLPSGSYATNLVRELSHAPPRELERVGAR